MSYVYYLMSNISHLLSLISIIYCLLPNIRLMTNLLYLTSNV